MPVKIPKNKASFLDIIPRGIGLVFVLSILLSISSSNHIFIAAEEPAPNAIASITRKMTSHRNKEFFFRNISKHQKVPRYSSLKKAF